MSAESDPWESARALLPALDPSIVAYLDTYFGANTGNYRIRRDVYKISTLADPADLRCPYDPVRNAAWSELSARITQGLGENWYNRLRASTHLHVYPVSVLEVLPIWSDESESGIWEVVDASISEWGSMDAVPANAIAVYPRLIEMRAEREQRRIRREFVQEVEAAETARKNQIENTVTERRRKSEDCFERLQNSDPLHVLLFWDVLAWARDWTAEEKELHSKSEFKIWYDLVLAAVTVKSKRAAISGLLNYLGENML